MCVFVWNFRSNDQWRFAFIFYCHFSFFSLSLCLCLCESRCEISLWFWINRISLQCDHNLAELNCWATFHNDNRWKVILCASPIRPIAKLVLDYSNFGILLAEKEAHFCSIISFPWTEIMQRKATISTTTTTTKKNWSIIKNTNKREKTQS